MQVILREDVPHVGKAGQVIKVALGYARNYLFPQKKAVLATPGQLKVLENERQGIEARREKLRTEAQALSERLGAETIVLERMVGEENKLFGSVTAKDLTETLRTKGYTIDKRLIGLSDPIRKLGSYQIDVYLHGDVTAKLKVEVTPKV